MAKAPIVIAGISALALAAIPAALAVGASGWLGFTITAHGFQRTLQQEERRAVYVGAKDEEAAAMKIDVRQGGPLAIDRADLDDRTLTVYLRNRSHERQCFAEVHWALLARDGTVLGGDAEYAPDDTGGLQPGDRVEMNLRIGEDRRAVALRLSATAQTAC